MKKGRHFPFNETFLIFRVNNRYQRIEIHRIRYQNRRFSKIIFLSFIYFLKISSRRRGGTMGHDQDIGSKSQVFEIVI